MALVFSTLAGDNGIIYAFEAEPLIYEMLAKLLLPTIAKHKSNFRCGL
jgi:hypothetical protein